MLVRCLYASRASDALDPAALDAILRQSHKNNPARGITGLLCCMNATFVQVIEGGRDEVGRLLTTLFTDPRHTGLQILSFEEIQERRFGTWTMGQVKAAHVNPALLLKYSTRADLDPFANSAAATMALLIEISCSGAITNRTG